MRQPFTHRPLFERCALWFADNGSKPFTKDSAGMAEYATGFRRPGAKGGAWIPGSIPVTENWAALMSKDLKSGIGVVNFETGTFLAGFSGKPGAGGSSDGPTGYVRNYTSTPQRCLNPV